MKRRSFLSLTTQAGVMATLGDLGFMAQLPSVSAAETRLDPKTVQFHWEIEPMVRFLEETPAEKILEELATRIRRGLTYRETLAALFLAGVRNIQPRPVGFKFHAVMVVHSAHLASQAAPDSDRWLPIFWAVNEFKKSQAADIKEGNWSMAPVDESSVPPSHKARKNLIEALDQWDESAADVATVGLVRTAGAQEIFEILARYGARDFREIGHKEIYVANSFRTLQVIGWQHAEPILRSLVYAILDRVRDPHPLQNDLPADRPFRHNLELAKKINPGWLDGKPSQEATLDILRASREGSPTDASEKVKELLNRGTHPQSIWDGLFEASAELMVRARGILSLHATTFTNASYYAFRQVKDEDIRRLLLLQNAAFLPLFRGSTSAKGVNLDSLEPILLKGDGQRQVEEIFMDIGRDRLQASRKILGYLQSKGDPKLILEAAQRLIFLKGTDSHDYKYSSAILEDYRAISSGSRDRFLAASSFYLKGAGDADSDLVRRTRAALA